MARHIAEGEVRLRFPSLASNANVPPTHSDSSSANSIELLSTCFADIEDSGPMFRMFVNRPDDLFVIWRISDLELKADDFYRLGGGGLGRYHSRSIKRSSSRSQGPEAGLLGTSSMAKGLLGAAGGGRALLSQSISFMRLRRARRISSLRPTRRATSSYNVVSSCHKIVWIKGDVHISNKQ